jgi:hypothetical protein
MSGGRFNPQIDGTGFVKRGGGKKNVFTPPRLRSSLRSSIVQLSGTLAVRPIRKSD